jgi:hypothetical protein
VFLLFNFVVGSKSLTFLSQNFLAKNVVMNEFTYLVPKADGRQAMMVAGE